MSRQEEDTKAEISPMMTEQGREELYLYSLRKMAEERADSDRERFMDTFAQVVENQSTAECEVKRFLESGREIWIKLRLKYINRVGDRKRHV